MTCSACGSKPVDRDGLCFRCRIATVGFTFRSAYTGRQSWNDTTVRAETKAMFDHARENKIDLERA